MEDRFSFNRDDKLQKPNGREGKQRLVNSHSSDSREIGVDSDQETGIDFQKTLDKIALIQDQVRFQDEKSSSQPQESADRHNNYTFLGNQQRQISDRN